MNNIFYHLDALGWSPGFFCSYQAVVGFLNFIEQQPPPIGYKVFFEKGLYFDINVGHNWWEYFFEPIKSGDESDFAIVDHPGDMLKSRWQTEAISSISRERAGQLIQKYIKIKPLIQKKIDEFVRVNFLDRYVIGIHYRGTDKSSEAPRVSFDAVALEVKKHLYQNLLLNKPNVAIFVATDEIQFIHYMRHKFGNAVIYTNAQRAPDDHLPIHHIGGFPNHLRNRYLLGEEAVIDCYLLSMCNVLIRTHSNLSSSAANINPGLNVIDLNHDLHCRDVVLR